MLKWGREISNFNDEFLQGGSRGGDIDRWVKEGAVFLGEDAAEVAVDGGGEVVVVRGNDGEIGGKKSGLRMRPIEGSWFWPDIDGELKRRNWRNEKEED